MAPCQGAANLGGCSLEGSLVDANAGTAADSQQSDRKRLSSACLWLPLACGQGDFVSLVLDTVTVLASGTPQRGLGGWCKISVLLSLN